MAGRITSAPAAFRRFRYTRPFWGGLFVFASALEIAYLPLGPVNTIIKAGAGPLVALACAALLGLMGLLLWFRPAQRTFAAVIAVLTSLASFPLSNLGGFVVGMILGILGGSLAFGWVPNKPARTRRKRTPAPTTTGPRTGTSRPLPSRDPLATIDSKSDAVVRI
jgi:hypothetical protein